MAAIKSGCSPDCSNVRSLINGRGNVASLFVGPDASVVWPSESLRYLRMRAAREEDIGVRISTRRERERPRSIVVHAASAPHAEPSFYSTGRCGEPMALAG